MSEFNPSEQFLVETLYGHRVVFRNKESYLQKRDLLIAGGKAKLHIVTDFDFTMSKFHLHGKRGASCHKVIEDCGLLSEDYHHKAQAVQLKYYPLEVDPTLDAETRTNYMIEWVVVAHKLLIESGLTKEIIEKAVVQSVEKGNVALRGHVTTFHSLLEDHRVPLLIFSAGIADVLEEILKQYGQLVNRDFVHVISNRCIFHGPEEQLSGFHEPVIHVFNKKSEHFLETPYFQQKDLSDRKNLILIGDSLGDVTMCEGMTFDPAALMKIGFLNDRVERLAQYLEVFDVVVLDDPDFAVPLGLVADICGEEVAF